MPKPSHKQNTRVKTTKKLSIKLGETGPLVNAGSELVKTSDWYKSMVEHMQNGVWVADSNLRLLYANPSICKLLGYTYNEMIGMHEFDLWSKGTIEKVKKILSTDRKRGISSSYEGGIYTKSGERIPILSHGTPLPDGGTVVIVTDIRELKKKDEELRKSEKRFKNMANLLPQVVFETDSSGNLLFVNKEAHKMFGYSEKEIREGINVFNLVAKSERLSALKNTHRFLRDKIPVSAEYNVVRKDGSIFPATIHVKPILKDNKAIGIRGILIDMTEKKRARELTLKLRSATEHSMDGVAMFDINGNIEFVNSAWAKMHGYKSKELVGKHLSMFHTKSQMKEEVLPFNEKVYRTGGNQGELGHVKRDGTEFPTFMSTTLIKDDKSRPIGFVGTAHDITKQKEAERIIEKRVREFNVLYRVHSHIRMVKRLSQVLTDICRDLVLTMRFPDISQVCITFDDKNYESSKHCKEFKIKIEEPIIIRGKKRGILRVGYTQIPSGQHKKYFVNIERQIAQTVAGVIGRHIASREVYERYQKIVQKSVTGLFIMDDGIIKEGNSRFGKIFKFKEKDFVGKHITEFLKDYDDHNKLLNSNVTSCSNVIKGRRKDGQLIDIDVVLQRINYHGKIGILGRAHDITKLKEAERKMHNFNKELQEMVAEKTHHLQVANKRLQSINKLKDEFIAITSHELRSPLTSIRGYLSFLVEDESLNSIPEAMQQYLLRAYNNAESLNYLVNNILDVTRLDTGRFELQIVETNLINLVKNVIDSLSFQIQEKDLNVRLNNLTKLDKFPIKIDTIRLTQVLRNLLDNAIKFSKRGKPIVVEISIDSGNAVIKVIDNGVGIPKSQIESVFDKFIQVKSIETRYKGGAGLGLFISKRIVELHDGIMKVESEINKGTTFTIQLPIK
ncbi:PAS domain S-box protein [Candidatus Peregrinibacteria bacterium]|nr:PAS domain S-box protein [Candidatus Peregrinibacteria bacterium]